MWRHPNTRGLAVALALGSLAHGASARAAVPPPRVPQGMQPCLAPLRPTGALPRAVGESLRYLVDVDGLSLGSTDFRIERRGTYAGVAVTEYRSLFKLDALVASFVPVEGRAAVLVPDVETAASHAMNRYRLDGVAYDEELTVAPGGRSVSVVTHRGANVATERRQFAVPVQDFISAFYMLRRLPAQQAGCTVIFGHGRAFTIWLAPHGREEVRTPVGLRCADRVEVTYASERSRLPIAGELWLSTDAARLPYRAEIQGAQHLLARIHLFEPGVEPEFPEPSEPSGGAPAPAPRARAPVAPASPAAPAPPVPPAPLAAPATFAAPATPATPAAPATLEAPAELGARPAATSVPAPPVR